MRAFLYAFVGRKMVYMATPSDFDEGLELLSKALRRKPFSVSPDLLGMEATLDTLETLDDTANRRR